MKTKKYFIAVLATVAFAMATAVPAFAADTYTPVDGQQVTFTKYLKANGLEANAPDATFTYTVSTIDEPIAKTDTTPLIKPGPLPANTTAQATFTAASAKYTTQNQPEGDTGITISNEESYFKSDVTLDTGSITFTEPGIYRYVITENATNEQGITNDADSVRYLDVYVEEDANHVLSVGGQYLHSGSAVANTDGSAGETVKSQGFVNEYKTHDLVLKNVVTGNLGEKDVEMPFVITITNADPNTTYVVNKSGATSTKNPDTITVGADGTVTQTVYLKHNETVEIYGLTDGTQYTISESGVAGYTVTAEVGDSANNLGKAATNDQGMAIPGQTVADDNAVTYINNLNGGIPQGLITTVAPYVAMVVIAAVAALVLFGRKKNRGER